MSEPPNPQELQSGIIKAMIVEGVCLAAGFALYFATDNYFWLLGAMLIGTTAMLLLTIQVGLFKKQ